MSSTVETTQKKIFITGIGTDVGKTIASAIVVEALEADYFKPVQAGDLSYSDTDKVQELVSNTTSKFHSNSYALQTPMSPHAAAEIDGITIDVKKIKLPKTKNNIVVEGAGGLLVPLNDKNTILDLIDSDYKVIVVSRHYLGSINHTLMTIQLLQSKGIKPAIIFSGDEHTTTESIIKKMTGAPIIGRIENEPYFDTMVIKEYAALFTDTLASL
ncbi:dethiobiotin synthase [Aquimarina sp. 2201CG14-23]|uniref:dethiobiotin synthase n=1 Tax=Aquimarina mycalae TaxID=3040073 RepID=UPI002477FE2F|nr:dethiobiotin synthase [Aquimarina sp. 2201CG14-23]MDH7446106.1 dethiobiotin synthase [Aquimarina sp. 2201CG14-23]